MSSYFGDLPLPVADFYDLLLARYYGEKMICSYLDVEFTLYKWDGIYYYSEEYEL